jgi:hypothetical protein
MNDINKTCWQRYSRGLNVGDKFNKVGYQYFTTLELVVKDYIEWPRPFIMLATDDYSRIYKIINNKISAVLTIDEAKRLLKLNQL